MPQSGQVSSLLQTVWDGSLPLEIRLAPAECRVYDQADPYLIQYPRLSYLPFLLPRLHAFFKPFLINADAIAYDGWFSFEDVPLKWQYPLGLLFDLFSGATPHGPTAYPTEQATDETEESRLPWRLRLHFTEWPEQLLVRPDADGKVLHDAFINNVKEADFLRNGTAKGIMSLSTEDSEKLWKAVQGHDLNVFQPIQKKLLYAQGMPLRHIPFKVYLPSSPTQSEPNSGHLRVVQSLVTPHQPGSREPQTLGTALHSLLPTLFPSRRTAILAKPVLHGGVVPLSSVFEDLMRQVAYLDGWLHIGIIMIG